MAEGDNGGPRTRAWVLLKVEDPAAVAGSLPKVPNDPGDKPWFIVRADVVKGEYNIVVPVDAAGTDQLKEACQYILGIVQPKQFVILEVEAYHPSIPHKAQGYVTQVEYDDDLDVPKEVELGLQRKSPGANAWG